MEGGQTMIRSIRIVATIAILTVVAAACSSDDGGDSATPPAATGDATTMDIVDTAVAAGDFDTLVAAVEAAGLVDTLKGEGPFTVFAPTDAAFAALPEGTLDTLLDPANQQDLSGILTYHVVAGSVPAADVQPGPVSTVNGATFTVDTSDGVTITDGQGNEAKVVTTDIETSNGVIHVIDTVLLPPMA
jgi:uncharacterized surface protein with fasciclin (FAS1) repeats